MSDAAAHERWSLRARGVVQGVGFRPWCVQMAARLALAGWVRNDGEGVHAEVQGSAQALAAFVAAWQHCPLPLARVSDIEQRQVPVEPDACPPLAIVASDDSSARRTRLPPDTAPCADCLRELFDPRDRRWRHAFINCTHCGPRLSVVKRLPYDRSGTSMAPFALCRDCAAEYTDVSNRRYHAQPVCCPQCGPRLTLVGPDGVALEGQGDPVRAAARRLQAGEVVALQGVGGFHLLADTRHPSALARLRRAKQRAAKPFALMVTNRASARRWVLLDDDAALLLESPARPVLLLPCRTGVPFAHPLVAPGLAEWGLMLPSSPLHWLMLHAALGEPGGPAWHDAANDLLWVVTSANAAGEPLVHEPEAAARELGDLADALLWHDRAIVQALDDSVRRPMGRGADGVPFAPFVRRARGYAPDPVELPGVDAHAPSVVATGGGMQNTVCVTRGNEAFVSAHGGDLGSPGARRLHGEAVERLLRFLDVVPARVAHELQPECFSTLHALTLAQHWGVPATPVQHHVAHGLAVLAEHGHAAPALALVLDGSGLGSDGAAWGGELFAIDGNAEVQRIGHLPALAQPGGYRAAAEPWRSGAAVLAAAGQFDWIADRFAAEAAAPQMASLLSRGQPWPATTSAGRLFDAAAALIAGVHHNPHEAHAAMQLEALAARADGTPAWPGCWTVDARGRLDWPGLWVRLAAPASDVALAAAAFHATLSGALVAWVDAHARARGLRTVALGGGCWINRRLRDAVFTGLDACGLTVLEAKQLPPGDGGLSLGQAAALLAAKPFAATPPAHSTACASTRTLA